MTPCPFCTHTGRYTDAYNRVRCEGCFNPLPGTPGVSDQVLHDDTAPMVVVPVPPLRGAAQTDDDWRSHPEGVAHLFYRDWIDSRAT